jgi:DNA-binding CsgD family transcriptional regulator
VVVGVHEQQLTAALVGTIHHAPSDELRRRVLADPIAMTTDCIERGLVCHPESGARNLRHSVLREALGLHDLIVGVIAPRGRTMALLAVETPCPALREQRALDVCSHVIGLTLESVLAREALDDLGAELRYMYTSSMARLDEANEMAHAFGAGHPTPIGLAYAADDPPAGASTGVGALLAGREPEVARLMAGGKTNREIAAELHIAPDTAKMYVARVLRKLGASNRVEAVRRYLELTEPPREPVALIAG